MASPLFVLLVSGAPDAGDDGFARCAWLRVVDLVAFFFKNRNKPGAVIQANSVLRFIHFDAHNGTVGIYEHDFSTRKGVVPDMRARKVELDWTTLDASFKTAFGTLATDEDPKNFVEWQPVAAAKAAGAHHPVSIVNAYHTLRKAPRGSILEFSVFSHAFVDGPVLYQGTTPSTTNRDPDDPDGRAAIDFRADMGEPGQNDALQKFRGAFAPTGSFRIWGCNIQDVVNTAAPDGTTRRCLIMSTVREVTNESFTLPLLRGGALAGLLRKDKLPPGSTSITLDMGREIAHERELQSDPHAGSGLTPFTEDRLFEIRYKELFPNHSYHALFREERDAKNNFAKVITRSLSDIVKFVAAETTPSYIFAAAQALQTVTVVGGAPGTSAEVNEDRGQFIDPARLNQAVFFSKFFGISMRDETAKVQPHYSFFDNQGNAVKAVLDRAANGLP